MLRWHHSERSEVSTRARPRSYGFHGYFMRRLKNLALLGEPQCWFLFSGNERQTWISIFWNFHLGYMATTSLNSTPTLRYFMRVFQNFALLREPRCWFLFSGNERQTWISIFWNFLWVNMATASLNSTCPLNYFSRRLKSSPSLGSKLLGPLLASAISNHVDYPLANS